MKPSLRGVKELDQRARPKGETEGRGAGNAIGKGNRVVEVRGRRRSTRKGRRGLRFRFRREAHLPRSFSSQVE